MKIVLDTTILVRAHEHTHGLARELLTSIVESEHTLLVSNEMLHELARGLRNPRLQAFYDLSENLVFDLVDFLRRSSEIVTLDPLVMAPIRDKRTSSVLKIMTSSRNPPANTLANWGLPFSTTSL